MTGQNTSAAVMAQRNPALDNLDDFPTPPWGTRAIIQQLRHIINPDQIVLEPCANRGHMVAPLLEHFRFVPAFDCHDYAPDLPIYDPFRRNMHRKVPNNGVRFPVRDFLIGDHKQVDWVFMNPPFVLAEEFIAKALQIARIGVAVFVRTSFLEGQDRYRTLFSTTPPTRIYQFAERISLMQGTLYHPYKKQFNPVTGKEIASTATAYCWLIWIKGDSPQPFRWIPPCRQEMEKPDDYPDWACYGDRAIQRSEIDNDERQRPLV